MRKEHLTLNISEIKPYEKNPRKNNQAVDSVVNSIQDTGYIAPVIVDENNIILAGHTRYKALKKLDYIELDVIKITGLSDEQKKKYRVLDNKTAEIAEWDYKILSEEFTTFELTELGFDLREIENNSDELDLLQASLKEDIDSTKVVINLTIEKNLKEDLFLELNKLKLVFNNLQFYETKIF